MSSVINAVNGEHACPNKTTATINPHCVISGCFSAVCSYLSHGKTGKKWLKNVVEMSCLIVIR